MKRFHVVFNREGGQGVRVIEAINAGQAFAKCLALYPDAKLVEAYIEGRFGDGYGVTTYAVPSMKKPDALPTENMKQSKLL